MNIGSRDTGGAVYGMIAAGIALVSVTGGTYITASLLIHEYLEMLEPEDVSDDLAMGSVLVWEVLEEWTLRGDEIPWPKKWKTWEEATWPEDFSRMITSETQAKWDALPQENQEQIRIDIAEVTRANSQMIEHQMLDEGFVGIMLDPMNILYLVLASITAFYAASRS